MSRNFHHAKTPHGAGKLLPKTNRNYYDTLRLQKGASAEQIKQAYKSLALEFHPDKNHTRDTTEAFQDINEAYNALTLQEEQQKSVKVTTITINPQRSTGISDPLDLFPDFVGEAWQRSWGRDRLQHGMTPPTGHRPGLDEVSKSLIGHVESDLQGCTQQ